VDECAYGDHVCIFEANEQYLRDRKVDKFITQILNNRARECYVREGPYDGFVKCRKLDEEYDLALTNYYIKC
jgi:NADH dehydrogenase (ubiquinone) 1 beta subcomplex subunit 10